MKTRFLRPAVAILCLSLAPVGARADESFVPASAPPAPSWSLKVFGLVRAGYDNVQKDPDVDFVGQNNGFVLHNARVGVAGGNDAFRLSCRVSVEGAVDVQEHENTPQGALDVRLRDAYVRHELHPLLGIQFGQFKAPFAAEELRDYQDLLFPSRAVTQEGVLVGRGFQQAGITLDRQVGILLSSSEPVLLGPLDLRYFAMVMNGNGSNQLLDDNGKPGLVGRLEVGWQSQVTLGVGGLWNERAEGEQQPDIYTEKDVGVAADLQVRVGGLQMLAQATGIRTSSPTTGAEDRTQVGFHAEAGYRVKVSGIPLTPAYRFAQLSPWQGHDQFDDFRLAYHTLGLRVEHTALPLSAFVAYTLTVEPGPRALKNNHLEVAGQLTW